MVDKKTGPVKPPVIDGNVRSKPDTGPAAAQKPPPQTDAAKDRPQPGASPASGAKPEPKTERTSTGKTEKPSATATPVAPAPMRPVGAPALLALALGSALAGAALAYGAALYGLWPQDEDAATQALNARIAELETRIGGDEAQLGQFDERIAQLEAAEPATGPDPDALAAIEAQTGELSTAISEIESRFEALASATDAQSGDTGALAEIFASIETRIDALTETLETLRAEGEEIRAELLRSVERIDTLEADVATQPEIEALLAEREELARLPQAISRLQADIAANRPFATALAEIETLRPDLTITDAMRSASIEGLISRDAILRAYRDDLPDILAARPADPDAGPLDTLLSQAQSAIALRPAGDVEGDSPDARLARFEARIEQGAYDAALEEARALPASMQEIMTPLIEAIETRLAATSLLEAARTNAEPDTTDPEVAQ